MNPDKLSRRRLLGGFLAGLTAWLCPRPRRAAATHRPARAADPQPSRYAYSATYTYDGMGCLIRVTHHSPCSLKPLPHRVHITREQGVTSFSYG